MSLVIPSLQGLSNAKSAPRVSGPTVPRATHLRIDVDENNPNSCLTALNSDALAVPASGDFVLELCVGGIAPSNGSCIVGVWDNSSVDNCQWQLQSVQGKLRFTWIDEQNGYVITETVDPVDLSGTGTWVRATAASGRTTRIALGSDHFNYVEQSMASPYGNSVSSSRSGKLTSSRSDGFNLGSSVGSVGLRGNYNRLLLTVNGLNVLDMDPTQAQVGDTTLVDQAVPSRTFYCYQRAAFA